MSQTTTQHAKTQSAKVGGNGATAFEVPAAFREAAQKNLAQATDAYERMKTAGEEANGVVEETFAIAQDQTAAATRKVLASTKANVDASFDFLKALVGAKTLAETIELQTAFARQQFEAISGQAKDWQQAMQAVATEVSRPAQAAWGKMSKDLKIG